MINDPLGMDSCSAQPTHNERSARQSPEHPGAIPVQNQAVTCALLWRTAALCRGGPEVARLQAAKALGAASVAKDVAALERGAFGVAVDSSRVQIAGTCRS